MDAYFTADAMLFFNKMPQAFSWFEALNRHIENAFDEVQVQVQKTQITYRNRYVFACVSLPGRRIPNCPKDYMLVTFGLPCRVNSPRIAAATQPYPNRWTHHVAVSRKEDIDAELMAWIKASYDFSASK